MNIIRKNILIFFTLCGIQNFLITAPQMQNQNIGAKKSIKLKRENNKKRMKKSRVKYVAENQPVMVQTLIEHEQIVPLTDRQSILGDEYGFGDEPFHPLDGMLSDEEESRLAAMASRYAPKPIMGADLQMQIKEAGPAQSINREITRQKRIMKTEVPARQQKYAEAQAPIDAKRASRKALRKPSSLSKEVKAPQEVQTPQVSQSIDLSGMNEDYGFEDNISPEGADRVVQESYARMTPQEKAEGYAWILEGAN